MLAASSLDGGRGDWQCTSRLGRKAHGHPAEDGRVHVADTFHSLFLPPPAIAENASEAGSEQEPRGGFWGPHRRY